MGGGERVVSMHIRPSYRLDLDMNENLQIIDLSGKKVQLPLRAKALEAAELSE